uniref:Leucine-rich repeat and coiled-coil domain-containing protein 1 n=1 Tax=Leptobrachium leishanense TaxID=445787 RepID=A0A8C5QPI0_9ANUR
MAGGREPESRELSLMDKHVSSLLEVSLNAHLLSINLHCNQISKIEGLEHLRNLRHLDLSSNRITSIQGLDLLTCLRSLNLSCNRLTKIEGLEGLRSLRELNLSYNRIHDLAGLIPLHGQTGNLSHLYLHSNCINDIDEVMRCIVGLQSLLYLTFQQTGKGNPVCNRTGYREILFEVLPHLSTLDGINQKGEPMFGHQGSLIDSPNLEFLEYMSAFENGSKDLKASTSKAENPVRIMIAKRDTDLTTESDGDSGKEIPSSSDRASCPTPANNKKTPVHKHLKPSKAKISNRLVKLVTKVNAPGKPKIVSHSRKAGIQSSISSDIMDTDSTEQLPAKTRVPQRSQKSKIVPTTPNHTEESTYRALIQELDQERERRWKAEQTVIKLTENLKEVQRQTKEEKDINSMAVYTTDRIKELLLKEKNANINLQGFIQRLKEENESLTNDLETYTSKEENYKTELKNMKDTLSKLESQTEQQQALEIKQIQEAERKASASQREVDLLRVSVRQQKGKVQQLHELLTAREEAYRKELASRVALHGPEFQDTVAKEVSKQEHCHSQQINEFQEKINALTQQYTALEDEFRAALIIEARRFKEVKDAFDHLAAELSEHKEALNCCQRKEKQLASLNQELTTMVKEQKARIAEITKAKQETTNELKSKIRTLEIVADEEKRKTVQIELLKQEKSKLISQLTAQESLIDGLKAERKIWGQELTQQGVSLAQDRGRLDAKIESLSSEIETLKKQNQRDNDALKIKAKVVDDQTETIRKLKEGLQERDERIRKLREENLRLEKALEEHGHEKTAQLEELKAKLHRQIERKEEAKLLLEEREAELEDMKKAYSAMNTKWQDKAELLNQLEMQVRQMKANFDAKEKKLIEERNKSLQTQKTLTEKLRSVDDAFRQQLELVVAAHQAECIKIASDKQREIEAAQERVYQVEEEMRQLLQETARTKRTTEEKIKRLTKALSDIQHDF